MARAAGSRSDGPTTLVLARQLAVGVERRTAMAIGAAGVLIAVIAGYIGYEVGSAQFGPVAACWEQEGTGLRDGRVARAAKVTAPGGR